MTNRIDRVNKHIQRTFGNILVKEADLPAGVLVTVSGVETTKNLRKTTVWLSVWPADQAEQVVSVLDPQMYDLQGSFNRKIELQPLPRIKINIDYGAKHAENIERTLHQLV